MKIFWVEDFGDQSARSSDRVSLTRTYMGPVLDAFWKSGSGENNWEQSANEDALVFMRTLASNASSVLKNSFRRQSQKLTSPSSWP